MTTYKNAGVDIDAGDELVKRIAINVQRLNNAGVVGSIGGFAGMFEVPKGYINPVIVSCTDGVGTKLSLALELDRLDGIGFDLVAMCVNDLICTGGDPLFFQDYLATSNLDIEVADAIIQGIIDACQHTGIALLGGETAEMPNVYQDGEVDLAGFATGMVSKHSIIDGSNVQEGDVLIGFESSGFHSNGYSLINHEADTMFKTEWAEELMEPTHIYVDLAVKIRRYACAMAHITGGGLIANVQRVLPKGLRPHLYGQAWKTPPVMTAFRELAGISDDEFARVFNQGIGFVVVCHPQEVDHILSASEPTLLRSWVIGAVRD